MVREVSLIGKKYYQHKKKNFTERFHEDLPLIEEREKINSKTERVFVDESVSVKAVDRKIQPRMGILAK